MKKSIALTLSAFALAAGLASATSPDLALVRVESSAEIKSAPAAAWKALQSAEGQALLGFKPDVAGQAISEGKIVHGDCAGDKGNLVVTHVEKGKEMRVTFDPDHGGYICRTRIRLEPAGSGVRLTFSDWYSEEKADQKEKNRAASQQGVDQGVQALKVMLEAKGK